MVTLVGMQDDFGTALIDLVELEYDTLEAYEAAINRLENEEYKNEFSSFKEEHLRHISEISTLLRGRELEPPVGPSTGKQWITKGKVVLGTLAGDLAILRAMRSNEIDTNTAYERLKTHEGVWPESQEIMKQAFKDEQKHKKWLTYILEND